MARVLDVNNDTRRISVSIKEVEPIDPEYDPEDSFESDVTQKEDVIEEAVSEEVAEEATSEDVAEEATSEKVAEEAKSEDVAEEKKED